MGFIPGAQEWFNICKLIHVIYHINKTKNENHLSSSIDTEKPSRKIKHSFMIKTLNENDIKGKYLNIIKAIHDKPSDNLILYGEKLKAFPLRSGVR